jgi:hypothetical protein
MILSDLGSPAEAGFAKGGKPVSTLLDAGGRAFRDHGLVPSQSEVRAALAAGRVSVGKLMQLAARLVCMFGAEQPSCGYVLAACRAGIQAA